MVDKKPFGDIVIANELICHPDFFREIYVVAVDKPIGSFHFITAQSKPPQVE